MKQDPKLTKTNLSRRERQIMDIVFELGRASAPEVLERIIDPPSYSSIRTILNILVDKGHLKRERKGALYIYLSTTNKQDVGLSELNRVIQTFFSGSVGTAVQTLIGDDVSGISDDDLNRLASMVEKAREEGR